MTNSHGPLRIGIGGPVGSGKTALMDLLCKAMRERYDIAAITNDIYTKWDAEFLVRSGSLTPDRIAGVETGGCPHTAIREDASMNLAAVADMRAKFPDLDLVLIESGGDNLAATFSPELADLTIYVIDVAAGDKIPSKGGPGITRSDLLVINKIDLAPHVGASLEKMDTDARRMRGERPFVMTNLKKSEGLDRIIGFIEAKGGLGPAGARPRPADASDSLTSHGSVNRLHATSGRSKIFRASPEQNRLTPISILRRLPAHALAAVLIFVANRCCVPMIAPPLSGRLAFILFLIVAVPADVRCLLRFFANSSFPSKRVVRLGFIIGFIALIGVLLSGLAAYRVHDQELTVDGIALARAIDVHASLVQDRLTERELLARVASGLFRAPSVIKANMLQPLRSSIYAFKTDFVVASWIARLKPNELDAARAELASAGFPNPTIRSFRRSAAGYARARPADRRADGCRAAQCRDHGLPGPLLRSASDSGADAGAGAWRTASRWRPIRCRCCARTGRSASCWPRRCCRRATPSRRAS